MLRYGLLEERTFVGLDVHKRKIVAAMLLPDGEVLERSFQHTETGMRRLAKWVETKADGAVACCYEAGPCGFGVQRELVRREIDCHVVAPSLIPIRAGDRVKTDRRDARKLASLLRAGELTRVHPPTPEEESVRDLCRCREDCRRALHRARQQLLKFLDRHSIRSDHNNWTKSHRQWVASLKFDDRSAALSFEHYRLAVEQCEDRLASLDRSIEEIGEEAPYAEVVGALRCFRGIKTLTAMILVSELYAIGRFTSPRELMSYVGLTPSEHSSGESESRGGITKAGNGVHLLRLRGTTVCVRM
jgi:transposase